MARTKTTTYPKVTPQTPEWEALTLALVDTLTPCRGSDAWTSDDAEDRAVAVRACQSCELLDLCRAAADSTRERFGVWAGVDRSPRLAAPPKIAATRRTA